MQLKSLASVAFISLITACSPKVEHLGKHPSDEALERVHVGDSQDQVMRALGSPTTHVTLAPNEWLYIYKVTEGFAFLDPKIMDQAIVKVVFDGQGRVRAVDRLQGRGQEISPITASTPAVGDDRTVLQQVFGNYGRSAKKERDEEYATRQQK